MAQQNKKVVLKGGSVCDPSQKLSGERDLMLEDGKISAIDKPGAFVSVSDATIEDVTGCVVVPGMIDIHVHLREPGYEWKETVLTGSSAAVAGGFTAVCCMPNTRPINDNAQVTAAILERAKAASLARVLPIGAITKGSQGKELAPMVELFESGCVAFSDDGVPVLDANVMRRALEYSSMLGAVLTVHEEESSLTHGFALNEGRMAVQLGLKGFPGAAEEVMIARDIELARLTGGRVHFCHVTTARGAKLIERAKEDGINVTAEVTPHHLTLTEDAVDNFNTQAKVSPPLRTPVDVEALRAALNSGVIDCVASDHAPHDADCKECDFPSAANGMLGLQTTLPLLLRLVSAGAIKFERVVEALTSSPARCFGLSGNKLAVNARADLTVLDLKRKVCLTPQYIRSKSKNTPFLNQELLGIAVKTYVDGRKVFELNEE